MKYSKFNKQIKICYVILILTLVFSNNAKAQSNWEAGVRIGNNFCIDATFPLSKAPRLHTAFYIENDFALGTYFNWMFVLDGGNQRLKFYPGVGPEFYFGSDFNLGVAGDFGIEYSFEFPLTVGVDWRPGFMITDSFSSYTGNWGILARFRFVKAK